MFSFITLLIRTYGVIGVGVLMLLENLLPAIPSELILPMAGFAAAQGTLNPLGAIAASLLGSIVGGAAWYAFGRWIGLDRLRRLPPPYARWLTLSPDEITMAEHWFQRWGGPAVCIGRAIPGVRGVICIPAGMAGMRPVAFLAWSGLGALIWTLILMGAGALLQAHYDHVGRWLNPVTDGFLALALFIYLVRVARFRATP